MKSWIIFDIFYNFFKKIKGAPKKNAFIRKLISSVRLCIFPYPSC